jgi:hypothetical protein
MKHAVHEESCQHRTTAPVHGRLAVLAHMCMSMYIALEFQAVSAEYHERALVACLSVRIEDRESRTHPRTSVPLLGTEHSYTWRMVTSCETCIESLIYQARGWSGGVLQMRTSCRDGSRRHLLHLLGHAASPSNHSEAPRLALLLLWPRLSLWV